MITLKLSNGVQIPNVGMGTWPLRGSELENLMQQALDMGYRLFDTADNYSNEEAIGEVLSRNASMRREIFIMTKISDEKSSSVSAPWSSIGKYFYKTSPYMASHSCKSVVNMLVENSLRKLKTDYIDCLIIHWPYPDYLLEIWDSLVELYKSGVLRSIGVSNCRERHIEKIKNNFSIHPMVNQISISPLDTRLPLIEYCRKEDIQVVSYAPLMVMNNPIFSESTVVKQLCDKYNCSKGQLLLAWNNKQGIIPIPKSTKRERLLQNLSIDVVKLSDNDISSLNGLNQDMQYLPESMYCPGL
jgi:diketogulonate reductase-like aldo/keto reductase